ncbi:cell surface protein [Schleiferilactobacillus perolens DSM 12744]|uniref:Cell surface protein n=1 Tax=Schleiferilactobacillus perolens DSM 12744 TaxID=1423792 RepID=A0A0R1MZZ3_9LACO|nr:cell surface protein [Schleiferilactobacillus perolens DSM 12744]
MLVALFAPAHMVAAATKVPKKAYSVTAILPGNQVDKQLNYWQLHLSPKQVQSLQLQVANIGREAITVRVQANNGTTDANPQIIYSQSASTIYPKPATSFASMVIGEREQAVTLAPGAVKILTFRIRAPADHFSGMILGGLYATADVTTTATQVRQIVAYQRSVVLQGKDINQVRPKIQFGAAKPVAEAGRFVLYLATRNTAPMYAYALTNKLTIYRQDTGKRVVHTSGTDGKIAPHSRFNWQFLIPKLAAGSYEMRLVIAGNNVARRTVIRHFTIEPVQVQAVSDYRPTGRRNFGVVLLLIVLIGVFMVVSWVLIYQRGRRHGQQLRKKTK